MNQLRKQLEPYAQPATAQRRKSAEIAKFPGTRLPEPVEDFGKSCARLLWIAFPGPSQNAVSEAAAMALGCSPDTIDRILGGRTKRPDPRLMFAALAIYQSRTGDGFPIGGGFEIRIVKTGAQQ